MANNGNDTIIKQPNWWNKRTRMERNLTLLSVIALILIICLIVILAIVVCTRNSSDFDSSLQSDQSSVGDGFSPTYGKKDQKFGICLSPGCVTAASNLLKHMNTEADPCDDFYEFACGNFIKTTKIPDDKVSVNTFTVISDELQLQLRNLLEGSAVEDEPGPFQLSRNVYRSCMNTSEIEKDGTAPLLEVIDELGKWPVLEGAEWNDADFDWIDSMYKFNKVGYATKYFFDFSISPDIKNSTLRMITMDQPILGLNREYLIKGKDDKLVAAYFEYMVDIAVLLGADKDIAKRELTESLNLEIAMANDGIFFHEYLNSSGSVNWERIYVTLFEAVIRNTETAKQISLPQEERRDANALYHAFTVADLNLKYPSITWLEFFNTLLNPFANVTESDVIVIYVPKYIEDLIALVSRVPKRVQANYVMWRAVKDLVSYTNEKLRQRQLVYSGVLAGITAHEPRWKECVSTVTNSLGIAIGAMYVRKHFDDNSKKTALEMVKDIRNEFRSNLEEVDWMDEVTRAAALEKADNMASHIAYPQELMDNDKITEYYEGLELQPTKFLRSVLNYTKFAMDYNTKRLREAVNRTEWSTHGQPAVVNAFYSSIENSIQFPAGVLQGDFFSSQRPRYMNYGAIGFIIAHEITHGFDDQGSQFDKEGNLLNWWAEDTKAQYLQKAQCIIDQYSNYTVKEVGLNLNGINTQGENIADNGGLKEVYLAYLKWVRRNGEEPALPGLRYSPKQLFWLSAANIWCSVHRPESLKRQITLGVHSPGRFRVLGPMSNMPQFSEDFKCSPDARMNPKHKCTVW